LLLFGAIVCAVFSQFYDRSLETGLSNNNVIEIERTLHELLDECEKLADGTIAADMSNPASFDSLCSPRLAEKGIYIFVADSLSENILHWSANLPVTAAKLKNAGETPSCMFFGDGWYITVARRHANLIHASLLLLCREYFYSNRFLKDEPNLVFHFPENVIVMPPGADIGIPVRDRNGVPLFTVNCDISPGASDSPVSLAFRWGAVFCLFLAALAVFRNPALYRVKLLYLLAAFLTFAGLRMFVGAESDFFYGDMYLFSPMLYADSEQMSSLGSVLLHLLFMFAGVMALFAAGEQLALRANALSAKRRAAAFALSCAPVALWLCFCLYLCRSLTLNSEISFKIYRMQNVTVYTFAAYLAIGLVFAQLCLLVRLQTWIFASIRGAARLIAVSAAGAIACLSIAGIGIETALIVALFVLVVRMFMAKERGRFDLPTFMGIAAAVSLYVSVSLLVNTDERERKKMEVLAQSLLSERDPVAEMLLKDVEKKIPTDPHLHNAVNADNADDLYNILVDKYFRGYFQRYELRFNVCNTLEKLHVVDEDRYENCIAFYENHRLASGGIPLADSRNFWFMNDYWGRIYYSGSFLFPGMDDTRFLFLDLYLKHDIKAIGYPELLKFESSGIDLEREEYSCAKYANGLLVAGFGSYAYDIEPRPENLVAGFADKNGYLHYTFVSEANNAVIMSLANPGLSGAASIFSYSFVIFVVLLSSLFWTAGMKPEILPSKNSYRRQITVAILAGITGALTALAAAMLAHTLSQSNKNNREDILNLTQSALIELANVLERESFPELSFELEPVLVRLSNVFRTDLNVYSIKGDLIASSRNEIFEKNLTGTKMNREAFHALASERRPNFIHLERIGEMDYYSSYAACYNRDGTAIAYLNLPYFDKQFEIRNELLSLTGAITNIYIFLIATGIALSVFLSNKITRPLDLVRRKMAKLRLDEQHEPIDYRGNNELGDLVREYNRMIAQLAESAKIMAESERESAWREMALQIAHEIKNPLTPMKLNVQLALRMKREQREGWREKGENAMKSILEQIDILANIASEFSDFARAGKINLADVNLRETVESGIALFAGYDNLQIIVRDDRDDPLVVRADREQLQRVLINLLKNAVQATENVAQPEITVAMERRERYCLITVSDNGTGISADVAKHLFRPNFTTKSGGTGLGLAISKSVIESFGGTITFVPAARGAKVVIRLLVVSG
jgi:signal transduction histidine kinase